jgi:catechol 2,3-dioxygenase
MRASLTGIHHVEIAKERGQSMAAVVQIGTFTNDEAASAPAPPAMRVGHAHLKVADLERSIAFYRDVLGLDVIQRALSGTVAFLSVGGYHHHIAVNTFQSLGGTPPPPGHTGLFHVAFVYPDRKALAQACKRVMDHGIAVQGRDHGVSEAVYFSDPDGNGVEIYWDCPPERWTYVDGGILNVAMREPFDPTILLAELADTP